MEDPQYNELDEFISANWIDLAKDFIDSQYAEFYSFCKEELQLTK